MGGRKMVDRITNSGAGNFLQNRISQLSNNETTGRIKDSFGSVRENDFSTNANNLKKFAGTMTNKAVDAGTELKDKTSSDPAKFGAVVLPLAAASGGTSPLAVMGLIVLGGAALIARDMDRDRRRPDMNRDFLQEQHLNPPINEKQGPHKALPNRPINNTQDTFSKAN
jgi:hypothetical protein